MIIWSVEQTRNDRLGGLFLLLLFNKRENFLISHFDIIPLSG
uniref:Uncharacterized protein n=1 Tax=Siphoviridae sp. ctamP19 TaxID=2827896 RepID=A0A8S5TNE0_9CAUD|nr:MAG TPA: hypothetical protein [Siphoviridae sp. ctamP19]